LVALLQVQSPLLASSAAEQWNAYSKTATAITGNVTLLDTPDRVRQRQGAAARSRRKRSGLHDDLGKKERQLVPGGGAR
jgi:hypothetical protein